MLDYIKKYLVDILENQDYYRFAHLHPHIHQWKDLSIDGNNIYSADGTTLTSEQIDAIHDIIPYYGYALVYTNKFGEKQVFFSYHNGTNGTEMDVVTSLWDTHRKLSFIKKHPLVKWTTLLEYNPDHCDDVYDWFITFIFK
jgi:hypothetical protein